MSIIKRFANGLGCFPLGIAFLIRHRLGAYVILPGLLCIVLALSMWTGLYYGFQALAGLGTDALQSGSLQIENKLLLAILEYSAAIVGLLLGIVLSLVLFRLLLSLSVLPFLGPLLEQIELILLGQKIETSFAQDFRNALYGMGAGLKHSLLGLLVLVLGMFLGPLNLPINVFAQSYFLGRGPFDMLFEKAADSNEERTQLKKHWRPEIFGAGLVFFLLLLIPVAGVLFAPIGTVTGAAVVYYTRKAGQ